MEGGPRVRKDGWKVVNDQGRRLKLWNAPPQGLEASSSAINRKGDHIMYISMKGNHGSVGVGVVLHDVDGSLNQFYLWDTYGNCSDTKFHFSQSMLLDYELIPVPLWLQCLWICTQDSIRHMQSDDGSRSLVDSLYEIDCILKFDDAMKGNHGSTGAGVVLHDVDGNLNQFYLWDTYGHCNDNEFHFSQSRLLDRLGQPAADFYSSVVVDLLQDCPRLLLSHY
nr:hypothetical protein [Tanacetum cinerariifolium]